MAWSEVTHTCGHTSRIQLYGPTARRTKVEEARARRACDECQGKEAQNETQNLVPLIGTDKQLQWAYKIRAEKYATIESKGLTEQAQKLLAIPLASWWIDNRDTPAEEMVRRV